MKIHSIYNYSHNPNKQRESSSSNSPYFQNKPQLLKSPEALNRNIPLEAIKAKYLNLAKKCQKDTTFEDWAKKICIPNPQVGEKYLEYALGYALSERLYTSLTQTGTDYTDDIFNIRNTLFENNFTLATVGQDRTKDSLENSNQYLVNRYFAFIAMIDILGTDSVLAAIKMKQHRFENLIEEVLKYRNDNYDFIVDLLVEKTNPINSIEYKGLKLNQKNLHRKMNDFEYSSFYIQHEENKAKIEKLQDKLKILKQNFSEENRKEIKQIYFQISEIRKKDFEAKSDSFKELETQMTEIKAKINALLKTSIKDPIQKIEAFYLHKHLGKNDYRNLLDLNKFISEGQESIKKYLKNEACYILGLQEKEWQIFQELGIPDSCYFTKIFQAGTIFKLNLQTLIQEIPDTIDLENAFNNLKQNEETKKIFESEGYDYKAWSTFDSKRDSIRIDENTVIRKVNMNDIKHSLFLGNQVGCCTAVGSGIRARFAPNYIRDKFVQAIELVVNDEPVGNTMCYLAKINNEYNVLVLDNVEVLKPYNQDPKTLDYFVRMAKQIATNIGAPELPILAGRRHKVRSDKFDIKFAFTNINILGASGKDEMNLDSIATMSLMNELLSPQKTYSTCYSILEDNNTTFDSKFDDIKIESRDLPYNN